MRSIGYKCCFIDMRSTKVSELTSESPVDRLDSVENHTAPSLLSPAGCCFLSDPVLSDERALTSELKPEKNSWSLTDCSAPTWIKKYEYLNVSSCCCGSSSCQHRLSTCCWPQSSLWPEDKYQIRHVGPLFHSSASSLCVGHWAGLCN